MENSVAAAPVLLTEGAVKEVKRLMDAPGFDTDQYLRLGVKGGGCSGLSYMLGFDKKEPNDNVFEVEGIPCIINKAHEIYLAGMEVDWSDGLNNRGFTFSNPNASSTCGCGTSFAV
ncbi:HesB/IscA family protein [Niabella hirudinis]|uniref:HesB/IscA family protein n=1 Tax=Niabella hirudinis TaxID=1285929 RepID=UPI003EC074A1